MTRPKKKTRMYKYNKFDPSCPGSPRTNPRITKRWPAEKRRVCPLASVANELNIVTEPEPRKTAGNESRKRRKLDK